MAKTFTKWYNNLPASKQKEARQFMTTIMGRSTMYKVIGEEFSPSPDRCQKIADYARVQISFNDIIYSPNDTIQ
jgi:hypothetical protein